MTKEEIIKTWVYYDPENTEYENILEEAHRLYRQSRRGVRGQTIVNSDFIEYWVYQVTKELYEN